MHHSLRPTLASVTAVFATLSLLHCHSALAQPAPGTVFGRIQWTATDSAHFAGPVSINLPDEWHAAKTLHLEDGTQLPIQRGINGLFHARLPSLPPKGTLTAFISSSPPDKPGEIVRIQPLPDHQWQFEAGHTHLVYQAEPGTLPRPDIRPEYRRGGYVAKVTSPSGRLVTDDFPPQHIHHHGIWTAWTKTTFEGRTPDFWNVGQRLGRVEFSAMDLLSAGPVLAGVRASQDSIDMTATPEKTALRESWELQVYHPGVTNPVLWTVFDLQITQHCTTPSAVELPEYHYGGLGVRGHSLWNGAEACLFLTSNGETNRIKAHATRANWCWMGGEVDGAITGIAILGHPDNFRSPQPMRIHPSEPFFCFAPQQAGPMSIEPGKPWSARYRFIVMDGAPDTKTLDQLWSNYAYPPAQNILR